MKKLRFVLSFTILPFYFLLAFLHTGMGWAWRGGRWLADDVWKPHVVYPVLRMIRRIQGAPLWQPIDLVLGIGPQTDEEKARLEAFAEKMGCTVLWPLRPPGYDGPSRGVPVIVHRDMTELEIRLADAGDVIKAQVASNDIDELEVERRRRRRAEASGEIGDDIDPPPPPAAA